MGTYGLHHDAALLGRALAPLGTAPTKIPMRLVAARINGVPRRCLPSRCIPLIITSTVPKGSNCSLDSTIIPNFTHSPSQSTRIAPPPYQPRTFAVPSSYLRRFMFGFRWRNPNMKRRRYEDGLELVRRWYGLYADKQGVVIKSNIQYIVNNFKNNIVYQNIPSPLRCCYAQKSHWNTIHRFTHYFS